MKKVVVLFVFFGILSCEENKLDPNLKLKQEIKIFNNTLVFKNEEAFKTAVEDLKKNYNSKYLNEWENKQVDFTSMKEAYFSIKDSEKEKIGNAKSIKGFETFLKIIETDLGQEVSSQILDPILSSFFNKEGLLIVGNRLIKIYNGEIFEANNYFNNIESKEFTFLKVGELKESFNADVNNLKSNLNAKLKTGFFPLHSCHEVYYGGDRAFTADFQLSIANQGATIQFLNFDALSWNVKHKNKSWGFWWTNKAPKLMANGGLYVYGSSGYTSINESCNDCSELNGYTPFSSSSDASVGLSVGGTGDDNATYHGCNIAHN